MFPALFSASVPVKVRRRVEGARDRHGNTTATWSDENIMVYGVAPRQQSENATTGRDFATLTGWEIYAPAGTVISAYDRVLLTVGRGLVECEVVGEPAEWSFTPPLGNHVSGVVFTVEKASG